MALVLSTALSACGSSDEIENAGTSKATEMELMEGEKVLGEEENVTDGHEGSLSATPGGGQVHDLLPRVGRTNGGR